MSFILTKTLIFRISHSVTIPCMSLFWLLLMLLVRTEEIHTYVHTSYFGLFSYLCIFFFFCMILVFEITFLKSLHGNADWWYFVFLFLLLYSFEFLCTFLHACIYIHIYIRMYFFIMALVVSVSCLLVRGAK